jgi:hypothetical protein
MLELTVKTSTDKEARTIHSPERMSELSVAQFQRLVGEWDHEDRIHAFSILSGIDTNHISSSTDGQLECALYEATRFLFDNAEWQSLKAIPMPEEITLLPIWVKDVDGIPPKCKVPKQVGRLSIGQAIQARKLLEGVTDIRECIGVITAIYLQPILDDKPFDMLEVQKYQHIIERMSITKIYPIGFFLLRTLTPNGNQRTSGWHQIKTWIRAIRKRLLTSWRKSKGSSGTSILIVSLTMVSSSG